MGEARSIPLNTTHHQTRESPQAQSGWALLREVPYESVGAPNRKAQAFLQSSSHIGRLSLLMHHYPGPMPRYLQVLATA
ncbi:hypothetical protein TIFTF001_008688 [Ficus carica]|uniref:Uncharacterized protein n=1 Tax=Ficus carica TaxID=3494 RepID=A0AA88AFG1_FICCA|nr:hypothetical protein TIFTF001_008688 [Ficus carica]